MITTLLKTLREEHGLSQDAVAKKLGLSRPTYISLEQGKRKLTLSEAGQVAQAFNITLNELAVGKQIKIDVSLPKNVKNEHSVKENNDIRISVPQKNLKRFKEVLLYILEKVGGKPNVGQTVLYKLLYFIDFDYYEKFEEQFIGATYMKNHHGPTPVEFAKIVKDMERRGELETVKSKYFSYEQTKYLPHREPDLSSFSARDKQHIDDVLARLSDKSAKELSDYSHHDIPYLVADTGKPLSYESVFYRDDAHSVRTYDDDPL